jgi:hypothetical protein
MATRYGMDGVEADSLVYLIAVLRKLGVESANLDLMLNSNWYLLENFINKRKGKR